MNKKGFFGDIGLILAIILLFSIVIIVGYKVFSSYNDKWQTSNADTQAKELVQESQTRYTNLFDGIFMFVFALLVIALFISAATIGTRPEFFFITMVLLVIFIGVSALISNVYDTASTSTQLNSTSSEFSFIPFLMDELPKVTLLLGVVVIIGLYVKIRGVL